MMKKHKNFLLMLIGLVLLLFSVSTVVVAQEDDDEDAPPFQQQDQVVSPEMHQNNSVTFRLDAPEAEEVTIRGQWMSGPGAGGSLELNDEGIWEITLGPITPDYYGYTFSVDGVRTLDPQNPLVIRDVNNNYSVLLVPGEESDLYMVHEVPHGIVEHVWYDSPTLGMERRMYVYTPPGYEDETNASKSYPVLYLLHGAGGDESAWTTLGRTPEIMDNLIARGEAEPMIVVMPNGNPGQAAMPGERPYDEEPEETQGGGGPGGMASGQFEQSVVDDIIPYIESHYRVISDDDHRAVAGLSMGGAQTQTISFNNPDMFNYVGVMSMGLMNFNQETDPAETRGPQVEELQDSDLELYWVGVGENDFLYDSVQRLRDLLDEHDFEYTYVETSGGHTWINWRKYLSELAPQLFK